MATATAEGGQVDSWPQACGFANGGRVNERLVPADLAALANAGTDYVEQLNLDATSAASLAEPAEHSH